MRSLSGDEVRWLRVRAQGLAGAAATAVADAVRGAAALQAQAAGPAWLQVWSRAAGLRAADVDAAVAEAAVVRTWLMRGTIHMVAADDLRAFLAVLGPVNLRADRRRRDQLALTDELCDRAMDALPRILAGGRALTRAEIVAELAGYGVALDLKSQQPPHLLAYAANSALICRGPDAARDEPTYVLLDDWLAAAAPPDNRDYPASAPTPASSPTGAGASSATPAAAAPPDNRDNPASTPTAGSASPPDRETAPTAARAPIPASAPTAASAPSASPAPAAARARTPASASPPDRETALTRLAQRYFAAYAPATAADLAAWSGLRAADAEAAVALVRDALEEVDHDGTRLLLPRGAEPAPPERPHRLLARFDPYLLGHRSRDLILDPAFAKRVNAGGGMIAPTMLAGGRVVGTWKQNQLEPFEAVPEGAAEAWQREMAAAAAF